MVIRIDDIKRADSDTPGGNFTEAAGDGDVLNNTLTDGNPGVADVFLRDNTDLASANHFAECGVPIWSAMDNFSAAGVMTRFASAAVTGYAFGRRHDASNDSLSIFRIDSAASAAELVTVFENWTGVDERIRGESIGGVHRLLRSGVDMTRIADTTYLTQLRFGAWLYRQTGTLNVGAAPYVAGVFDNVSAFTNLATAGSATDATSYATASVTPASGSLVICCIVHQHGTAIPKQADSVTGTSISGAQLITKIQFNTVATSRSTLELWAAIGTGSAGVITFNYAAGTSQTEIGAAWSIIQVTNVDTTKGTNGVIQSVSNAANGATTFSSGTIATPFKSQYNPTLTVVGRDINSAVTPTTSHIKLGDVGHNTPTESITTLYCTFGIPVGGIVSSSGTSSDYGAITIEIASKIGMDVLWKPRILVAS